MDPAHTSPPQNRFEQIERALQQHEEQMAAASSESRRAAAAHEQATTALAAQVQQLTQTLSQTLALVQSAAPSPAASALAPSRVLSEPHVGTPERYTGELEGCDPFLTNCSILFALQPLTFATEEAKVAYAISHLWGTAKWDRQTSTCSSFQAFAAELRKVFGMEVSSYDSAQGLLKMHQGNQTVADFAIDFRIKARRSEWNMAALCDAFLNGLADYIKDKMVSYDLPTTLDSLMELATRINLCIQARRREKLQRTTRRQSSQRLRRTSTVTSSTAPDSPGGPEPM
ncbi:hypothetical protein LDENG_00227410 [Lucifuga dentata]|nr:hypothetical protein LDENG_00227410 [Lucifuga dentata]